MRPEVGRVSAFPICGRGSGCPLLGAEPRRIGEMIGAGCRRTEEEADHRVGGIGKTRRRIMDGIGGEVRPRPDQSFGVGRIR